MLNRFFLFDCHTFITIIFVFWTRQHSIQWITVLAHHINKMIWDHVYHTIINRFTARNLKDDLPFSIPLWSLKFEIMLLPWPMRSSIARFDSLSFVWCWRAGSIVTECSDSFVVKVRDNKASLSFSSCSFTYLLKINIMKEWQLSNVIDNLTLHSLNHFNIIRKYLCT